MIVNGLENCLIWQHYPFLLKQEVGWKVRLNDKPQYGKCCKTPLICEREFWCTYIYYTVYGHNGKLMLLLYIKILFTSTTQSYDTSYYLEILKSEKNFADSFIDAYIQKSLSLQYL